MAHIGGISLTIDVPSCLFPFLLHSPACSLLPKDTELQDVTSKTPSSERQIRRAYRAKFKMYPSRDVSCDTRTLTSGQKWSSAACRVKSGREDSIMVLPRRFVQKQMLRFLDLRNFTLQPYKRRKGCWNSICLVLETLNDTWCNQRSRKCSWNSTCLVLEILQDMS